MAAQTQASVYPGKLWKPQEPRTPEILSVTELIQKRAELMEEIPKLRSSAELSMKLLLIHMGIGLEPYDAHDDGGLGADYIVVSDDVNQLPYLVQRINSIPTKWEECETAGRKKDFIARFMVALPWFQKGYLKLSRTLNREARECVDQIDRVRDVKGGDDE
jgi:hypothetical protein